ncbi:hypothetical protein D915_006514 [Fasciola hepatica]|uniref:Uncharacterized protein n=1 Tax=Fasciola hepatica TaxID=6192 RepID=A0A4E0R4G9_FASHE|nr:hypothetical protein D915_006514 [Fasciola hepatica]
MTWERLLSSAQSILDESILKEDEETLNSQFWDAKCALCLKTCGDIRQLLEHSDEIPLIPPVQLLMFIGAVLSNQNTSCKLHRLDQLKCDCESLLTTLLKCCACPTTRGLLLSTPHSSSLPHTETIAQQFLRLCVAQIARAPAQSQDEALSLRPFFRDALLWLAEQLDYPEMAGDEYLGVLQPFGLRLCGDYRPAIQMAGLKLLRGLTDKARIADWRQSNRAEAVISQLFEHRLGCNPGSSEQLLQAVYETMIALIQLLESYKTRSWYNKIASRLLCDIVMEGKKTRLAVLLRQLSLVIDTMKTDFVGHSRRFLHVVSVVLLGPQTPGYMKKSLPKDAQDETIYTLILQCLSQFIRSGWPVLSSPILPSLIAPLVAFVDLMHSSSPDDTLSEQTYPEPSGYADYLVEIFTALVDLEPRILSDILIPACYTVPSLKRYLPEFRE